MNPYDDIINLDFQPNRARMPAYDRAAQFAPFAALTGFGAVISETSRLTDSRPEPDAELCALLNERLAILRENLRRRPKIELMCFVPDERKEGGSIQSYSGSLRRIDEVYRVLEFTDKTKIPLDDIVFIGGEVFKNNCAIDSRMIE